jgi:hypothetical protein
MATIKKTPAKKTAAPKRDTALCHWHAGSYGSPKTADCKAAHAPNKQLCAEHEKAWKVVAKKRVADKKAAMPATPKLAIVPKSAGTSPAIVGKKVAQRAPKAVPMAAMVEVTPTAE